MPIPTQADYDLSEIDDLAGSIKIRLSVMRHAGKSQRDFQGLREALQSLADKAMAFARSTEQ